MKLIIAIIFIVFNFIACTNETSVESNSDTKIAYFVDSTVNGLEYECKDINGITGDYENKNGSFRYKDSCEVRFTLGKVYVGSIHGSKISKISDASRRIYPTNLINDINTTDSNDSRVLNIIRFLQSLDDDDDIKNGINITQNSRNTLNNVTYLDLTSMNTSNEDLNNSFSSEYLNKKLMSSTKALEHFEQILREQVDPNVDTTGPAIPYLTNKITAINTSTQIQKMIELNGEPLTKVFMAYNTTGDDSNLSFDNIVSLDDDGKAEISLTFDDINASYFHYYFYLQDNKQFISDTLHISVFKDTTSPNVQSNEISIQISEQELFVSNIFASDNSDLTYKILTLSEDNRSVNYNLFEIDENGNVSFKKLQNFDDNANYSYTLVANAQDEASNGTNVFITVDLFNVLDNPPALTSDEYNISILEEPQNNIIIYELNTTLQSDIDQYPDNNLSFSAITYVLHNHTDLFEVNTTTGSLSIKNNTDDLFDYEKLNKNDIDLNISVENNNTTDSGFQTFVNIHINIVNKIDTTPSFTLNSAVSISEHNSSSSIIVDTAIKDISNSDYNLSMLFSIEAGDDGNFSINENTGAITIIGDNLDFESKNEYTLKIRATNTLDTNKAIDNFYDVNLTINILDVIDNAPVIIYKNLIAVIPEDTNANFTIANVDTNGSIADENVTTSYTLITQDTPFKVDNAGIVSTSRKLINDYNESMDANSLTSYTLEIQASNTWWNNSINNSNIITFDIDISNVVDNAPKIKLENNISISVDENLSSQLNKNNVDAKSSSSIGMQITQILKDGNISDENNITTYHIISGNDEGKFSINEFNGIVDLNISLDYETTQNYNLGILAKNTWYDGSLNDSNILNLKIDVKNKIEKTPKKILLENINVHENTDTRTIIHSIKQALSHSPSTIDELSLTNFAIVNGNDGNFTILSQAQQDAKFTFGNLMLDGIANKRGNLDYESKIFYNLDILTSNAFGDTHQDINISIIDDVDDELPFLIIAINYADISLITMEDDLETLFFNEKTDKSRLSEYFNTVSKGKFTISAAKETNGIANNGIIVVNLDRNHTKSPNQLRVDIQDALSISSNDVDFNDFDTYKNINTNVVQNDGVISDKELQIIFIIAGGDYTYGHYAKYNVVNNINSDIAITSVTGTFKDLNLSLDSKKINTNYYIIGELLNNKQISIGLIAKLVSEQLLKFTGTQGGHESNEFALMGNGFLGFDNNHIFTSHPVHPSAFNKVRQGWVIPTLLKSGFNDDINFFNTHDNTKKFNIYKIDDKDSNIYYLLENRNYTTDGSYVKYDNGIRGLISGFKGGIIIWEVDLDSQRISTVKLNNTQNVIFRDGNSSINDLPAHVRDVFEFTNTGTMIGKDDDAGNKQYTIGIKVK